MALFYLIVNFFYLIWDPKPEIRCLVIMMFDDGNWTAIFKSIKYNIQGRRDSRGVICGQPRLDPWYCMCFPSRIRVSLENNRVLPPPKFYIHSTVYETVKISEQRQTVCRSSMCLQILTLETLHLTYKIKFDTQVFCHDN